MRDLMKRRNPPDTPNFFELELGDLAEVFKLPNFATRQELIQLYAGAAGDGDDSADLLRAMAATLGACWWGREKALEVDYLEDSGVDVAQIVKAGGECVTRVASSIPGEQEVREKQAFTKAEAEG